MKRMKAMKKWMAIVPLALMSITMAGTPVFDTPAYAATAPSFSDVPSGHWAYSAVQNLVKAGLVDGYDNNSFKGDRAISRYEFAVIVSRSMEQVEKADKANIELINKLAAEFAAERNLLNARVKKVETKTNTWVSGETRFRYLKDSPAQTGGIKLRGSDSFDFRQRVVFRTDVTDKVSAMARIAASGKWGNHENGAGSTTSMDLLNVTANKSLGLDTIRVGRMGYNMFGHGLMGKPAMADGVGIIHQIGDTEFKAWTGNVKADANLGTGIGDSGNANQLTSGELSWKLTNKLTFKSGYYWADIPGKAKGNGMGTVNILGPAAESQVFSSSKGWLGAFSWDVGNKYTVLCDYISTSLQNPVGLPNNPKAWAVQLAHGNGGKAYYNASNLVNVSKANTSGWAIGYHVADPGAIPNQMGGFDTVNVAYSGQPYSIMTHATDNVKGFQAVYQYVVDKNILLSLDYSDYKIKNRSLTNLSSDDLDKTYSARIQFFY